MDKNDIKNIVEQHPFLKEKIFARGFYFTDGSVDTKSYPFYGLWNEKYFNRYILLVSPKQSAYFVERNGYIYILIGHAYNPFQMIESEMAILQSLAKKKSEKDFWDEFNELTGVFTFIIIHNESVILIGDPTGMQTTFYCIHDNKVYISSHTNCIGDLLELTRDSYVEKLISYRFFKLLGNSLPGDLTQFTEVKRLVPNHYIKVNHVHELCCKRFYWPEKLQLDKEEIINCSKKILKANIELISRKWEKPAISMTGGVR